MIAITMLGFTLMGERPARTALDSADDDKEVERREIQSDEG